MSEDSLPTYFDGDIYVRQQNARPDGRYGGDELLRVTLRGQTPEQVLVRLRRQIDALLGEKPYVNLGDDSWATS